MKSEATHAQKLFFEFESKDGYDRDRTEYQTVTNPEIARLLTSKSGSGKGKPEMVYQLGANDLLVWEIKQTVKDFSSHGPSGADLGFQENNFPKPKEMAEDGVIHYMNGCNGV